MNTIPGITDADTPPLTEVDFQFQSLPKEVQIRILAQHCQRLLQDNDTLEAENKYLRERNAQLKCEKGNERAFSEKMKQENARHLKDLRVFRKFVKAPTVIGLYHSYCKANGIK